MADCLLTLDYELFFQKSGDASVSLLKPTAELLEVLERIGGKAVFFVENRRYLRMRSCMGNLKASFRKL